jgi:hypothetical protein
MGCRSMAEADIQRTMRAIEQQAERVMKRIGFAVHGELIRATPVDTGWARANWQISIGRPTAGAIGSKDNVAGAASAQSAGTARLLVYNVNQGDIWLGNHVPYIQKLNEGHSKQAPANWVERAIRAGIASVTGAIKT